MTEPLENAGLNAEETAALLGVSKNTVYAMKNRGELPSYRVGRKLRFRVTDIEEYLGTQKIRSTAYAAGQFAVNGSDVMLDIVLNYLTQYGITPKRSYMNSYDGLVALYRGEIAATTSCLWDGKTGEYNIPYARRLLPGVQAMVIKLASRSRGFIVKKGNPKGILGWEDLLDPGVRIANRPAGTGARVLLDEHLQQLRIDSAALSGYTDVALTNTLLTGRVARGHADVVVGTERMAYGSEGLEFVFLQKEDIDMIIRSDTYDTTPVQALVDVLESGIVRHDFPEISGYDLSHMGRIVWIG
jgi:putative molybdopterin biosynthesis protein